jgi:hypothetical protein
MCVYMTNALPSFEHVCNVYNMSVCLHALHNIHDLIVYFGCECVCVSVCIQHTLILIYVLCMCVCVCVCVCVNNIIARIYSKNYCVITVSFVYTCEYNYIIWVSACANSGALFLDYHTCAMLITVCFMYMYVCLRVQIYNARGLIFRLPYPVYHSLFHVYVYVSACT